MLPLVESYFCRLGGYNRKAECQKESPAGNCTLVTMRGMPQLMTGRGRHSCPERLESVALLSGPLGFPSHHPHNPPRRPLLLYVHLFIYSSSSMPKDSGALYVHIQQFKHAQRLRRTLCKDFFALMPLYLQNLARQLQTRRVVITISCRLTESIACLPFPGMVAAAVVKVQDMLQALGSMGKPTLELVQARSLPLWNGALPLLQSYKVQTSLGTLPQCPFLPALPGMEAGSLVVLHCGDCKGGPLPILLAVRPITSPIPPFPHSFLEIFL